MCLGAIYWARLSKIYFANNRDDAARIGFDDELIYRELPLSPEKRSIPSVVLMRDEASKAFAMWSAKTDKTAY